MGEEPPALALRQRTQKRGEARSPVVGKKKAARVSVAILCDMLRIPSMSAAGSAHVCASSPRRRLRTHIAQVVADAWDASLEDLSDRHQALIRGRFASAASRAAIARLAIVLAC